MEDSWKQTNLLLTEILGALQTLDCRLEKHAQRIEGLEAVRTREYEALRNPRREGDTVTPSIGGETIKTNIQTQISYTNYPPPQRYIGQPGDKSGNTAAETRQLWTDHVGDAWKLPPDHRIDLGFQKHFLENLPTYDLLTRLKGLQQFNDNLLDTRTPINYLLSKRLSWFRHFAIADTFLRPVRVESYTLGQARTTRSDRSSQTVVPQPSILVPFNETTDPNAKDSGHLDAPWQRLITLQGLSSVILKHSDSHSKWREQAYPTWRDACPFLMPYDREVCSAVDSHLSCERRDFAAQLEGVTGSATDYRSNLTFHITFYEICYHDAGSNKDLWKVGKLYNDPKNRWFRECACTIFARSSSRGEDFSKSHPRRYEYWTILQLTPEGFGRAGNATGHMDLATLSLVSVTLEKVTNRWSDLVDFFRALLDGANSLLDPVGHDHLLFDNEDFTKSREYFWAINCLVEFEASISANIEQWDEFRRYITPLAELEDSPVQLETSPKELLERCDGYCARLKKYHRFFQDKRTTTVALRDGLFSASAVMEGRAATRLGENIKLLTFVSVFFLPLSFCTSIWSTQNGPSNPTTLIYVCVIVGFVTYTVVFNLNILVRAGTQTYETYKLRLVGKMRRERDPVWKQRGECYDVFRPVHRSRKPTEWFLLLYLLWRVFVRPWRSTRNVDPPGDVDTETEDGERQRRSTESRRLGLDFRNVKIDLGEAIIVED